MILTGSLIRVISKEQDSMQKITPFLWFDGKAEEAMNFYVSIFRNSKVVSVTRYGEGGPGPKGTVMSATFELDGQQFIALNGGPMFTFSPAISFFVNCETQEEVDELWEKLSEGGEKTNAAGLKTNMACHGRSFLLFWARCCRIKIRRNQEESWKQCLK
jgi:predicted 3-demethylubiquinone-9 3-methyltransferase (glyoxalase superfamily)